MPQHSWGGGYGLPSQVLLLNIERDVGSRNRTSIVLASEMQREEKHSGGMPRGRMEKKELNYDCNGTGQTRTQSLGIGHWGE